MVWRDPPFGDALRTAVVSPAPPPAQAPLVPLFQIHHYSRKWKELPGAETHRKRRVCWVQRWQGWHAEGLTVPGISVLSPCSALPQTIWPESPWSIHSCSVSGQRHPTVPSTTEHHARASQGDVCPCVHLMCCQVWLSPWKGVLDNALPVNHIAGLWLLVSSKTRWKNMNENSNHCFFSIRRQHS